MVVSTHPAFYSPNHSCEMGFVQTQKYEDYRFADGEYNIIIGNDVWIGTGARIVDGITVGNGAVILAGAVVTKNVPDYGIVGGIPARLIRKRFDDDTIHKLLDLQWWNKDIDWIKDNAEYFDDIDALLNRMKI